MVNVQLATVKHILTVVVASILCILELPPPLEYRPPDRLIGARIL